MQWLEKIAKKKVLVMGWIFSIDINEGIKAVLLFCVKISYAQKSTKKYKKAKKHKTKTSDAHKKHKNHKNHKNYKTFNNRFSSS